MARLILLDRDGVINADSPDFIKDVDEWMPIPGAIDAIVELKEAGRLVAVCTNQSGVGRGIVSLEALERIHAALAGLLAARGVALDGIRYCPHRPEDGCRCRKPLPGMLLDTMADLGVRGDQTLFVGDNLRDVRAAQAAGCCPVLVRTGRGSRVEAEARTLGVNWVADDLRAVARTVIGAAPC